jgi:hypothetical protein
LVSEGLSLGRKLFEEVDKPTASKVVFEDKDKGMVERESTWTGDIKGYNSFPSGIASGSLDWNPSLPCPLLGFEDDGYRELNNLGAGHNATGISKSDKIDWIEAYFLLHQKVL